MFNVVEKRRWFFLLSALVIGTGLLIMVYSTVTTGAPFRLSIDFAGGSIYDVTFESPEEGIVTENALREVYADLGDENVIIQQLGRIQARWLLANWAAEEDVENSVRVGTLLDAVSPAVEGDVAVAYNDDEDVYRITLEPNVTISETDLRAALDGVISEDATLTETISSRWSVRAGAISEEDSELTLDQQVTGILDALEALAPVDRDSLRVEAVSATIGQEVTRSAFLAVLAAAVVITSFIVIAFRQVPNAFRYGVCAIAAMVHDVLIVMGVMSLLGLLVGWEVDALFLTAVLTVVGFSVQDSIVVFDRIRENIPLRLGEPYETIVNRSLWETIHRSLATQLNAFFIMVSILLFGGETIQHFIFILFIGLLSGSYSSLFTAVPLLVAWEKGEIPFLNQESDLAEA